MATTVMCSGLALAGEPAVQGQGGEAVSLKAQGCLMTREEAD
jgi:hypothetical protein